MGINKLVSGLVFLFRRNYGGNLGSELFTSSTLTLVARVGGKITLSQMIRNWIVLVYWQFCGRFIYCCSYLVWGQTMVANGQWGLTILATAQHKIHHTWF